MLPQKHSAHFLLHLLALFFVISSSLTFAQPILQLQPFRAYYLRSNLISLSNDPSSCNQNDVPIVDVSTLISIPSFAWGRNIQSFVDKGFFAWEKKPSFYIYAQQKDKFLSVGIIGKLPIQNFLDKLIKQHEAIIPQKADIYAQSLKIQAVSFEPILLGYKSSKEIDELIAKITKNLATFAFCSVDGTRHSIWQVSDNELVEQFSYLFSQIGCCYLLDGHHRAAAICKLYKEQQYKTLGLDNLNLEMFSNCNVALFPDHQIHISAYNRILKNIPQLSDHEFLNFVEKNFAIEAICQSEAIPQKQHEIGMYFSGRWFRLTPVKEVIEQNKDNLINSLDINLANNYLIKPLSKKYNEDATNIVEYINATVSLSEIEKLCSKLNAKAAFIFYPIDFETIVAAAENQTVLPEKSTWIEPKINI